MRNSFDFGLLKIPSVAINGGGQMLGESAKYTASTGQATISTANSSLTGGTMSTIITGANNGTFIKTLTIKGGVNTTQGMVRLFIEFDDTSYLVQEVEIPYVTASAKTHSYSITIPFNFNLQSGHVLRASTEQANTFYLTAEGLNWTYP